MMNSFPPDETRNFKNETGIATHIPKTILFFGDSLTAGYGLRPYESFPAIIQQKINLAGLLYKTINAGVSGETTFGGTYRINGFVKDAIDIFVLELGINDGLRGIPVADTRKNLQLIIDRVKATHPKAQMVLAGMQVPPWLGQKYAEDFREMFPALANKNSMYLIPFLLHRVAGVRSLNLPDGAHPSAQGQKLVAENVWAVLRNVLEKHLVS
ncbi:MAG: arylesterase [Bacteroidota bacterium]|nr:arylesterase [Bacteroidota bacterium]